MFLEVPHHLRQLLPGGSDPSEGRDEAAGVTHRDQAADLLVGVFAEELRIFLGEFRFYETDFLVMLLAAVPILII